MIRPLHFPEENRASEYINRVKQTEHGREPGARDFAYEIREAGRESPKRHHSAPEFGEDTYEPSDENEHHPDTPPEKSARKPLLEDGNLDLLA